MPSHHLESLTGIGPATAQALIDAGFVDRESIAAATVEQLVGVRGFAEARASALIAEAQSVVSSADATGATMAGGETPALDPERPAKSLRKQRKKLRAHHAELERRAKKARKKSKAASSKKKRKHWAAEADRFGKKAKKVEKRLARLG